MDQPADAPARHRPGFRETVDHEQCVFVVGDLQERRRMRRAVIDERAVDFVTQDGDAARAREFEDGALFVARHGPAGRIVGARDEDRFGPRVAGVEQLVEIETPMRLRCRPVVVEADEARSGPADLRRLHDVGPDGRDGDDIVAGLHDGTAAP